MKYAQPFGVADPNASYIDRDTPGAVAGSRLRAAAIEHPQREILSVITAAGLTPSSTNLTQLLQAISLLIDSATGGAETSTYVLMAAARARLPIYPEIISADGTFNLSTPAAGTVRMPAGVEVVHRGIYSFTTVEQDFATAANKTYHLRWNPDDGFALKDVANATYNPSALPEAHVSFDTSHDDMISHRVVTNASNIATITNLSNKDRLMLTATMTSSGLVASSAQNARCAVDLAYNWSRAPKTKAFSRVYLPANELQADRDEMLLPDFDAFPGGFIYDLPASRYRMNFVYLVDGMSDLPVLSATVGA